MKIRRCGDKNSKSMRFIRHLLRGRINYMFRGKATEVLVSIEGETEHWVYMQLRIFTPEGGWKGTCAYDKVFDDLYVERLEQYYQQFKMN